MSRVYEGKTGVGQIIFCIIAAATVMIPVIIAENITFAYQWLPIIGDGSIIGANTLYFETFMQKIGLDVSSYGSILDTIKEYCFHAFYGIIAFDFLFALIQAFLRSEVLRKILKFISVLLGFVMLILTVVFAASVAGFIFQAIDNGGENLAESIMESGAIYLFVMFFFAFIAMFKQFGSFFGKSY